MKKHKPMHGNKCSLGKAIHYSLITLIELADKYYCGGSRLTYISKQNDIPMYILIPIIDRIKETGLIECRKDDNDWLFLKKEPHGTWIIEVVVILRVLFKECKQ